MQLCSRAILRLRLCLNDLNDIFGVGLFNRPMKVRSVRRIFGNEAGETLPGAGYPLWKRKCPKRNDSDFVIDPGVFDHQVNRPNRLIPRKRRHRAAQINNSDHRAASSRHQKHRAAHRHQDQKRKRHPHPRQQTRRDFPRHPGTEERD